MAIECFTWPKATMPSWGSCCHSSAPPAESWCSELPYDALSGNAAACGSCRAGRARAERRARQALITVPPGVLQAHTIAFAPAPEQTLAHARRLAMGEVVRISLLF